MGRRAAGWTWRKVSRVHGNRSAGGVVACTGEIHSYRYRCHQPSDRAYERCIALTWCSTCRQYAGAMVYVPRDETLTDLVAALPTPERERLTRTEAKLLDHLDRLARRGAWPPAR